MATEVAPVVGAVLELSRQVLVQSKHLADLINVEGTTEDAIIDAAKLTAGITAQLYNTLAEAVQHGSSDQALKTSLLNSAKEVRAAILDLIQSTKDALLNPFDFQATQKVQNCLHGDTPITLASGVSMKIKDLTYLPEVLTLRMEKDIKNFVPGQPNAYLVQGQKECIELLFNDGRKLVCTPEHLIRTVDSEGTDHWCRADQLVAQQSRVVLGIEAPLFDPAEDAEQRATFQLTLNELETLCMSEPEQVARAHAFARILGSLYTDGSASCVKEKRIIGRLLLGHRIDAEQAMKDVKLVTGNCLSMHEPNTKQNYYTVRINSKAPLTHVQVWLPARFIRALHDHPKIRLPYGKRKYQDYPLPELFMDPTCPKSLVREFLGGLFGGDGEAPIPTSQNKTFHSVAFSMSKEATMRNSLMAFLEDIRTLLSRFNITKVEIDNEQDITGTHPSSKSKPGEATVNRVLRLSAPETLAFQEHVGFRYCAHKQQRLAVAAAFFRMDNYSRKQAQEFVLRVNRLTKCSEPDTIQREGWSAYKSAVTSIPKSELFLNKKVTISSLHQVRHVLGEVTPLEGVGAKLCRIKPYQFIASMGATKFFSESPGALAAAAKFNLVDARVACPGAAHPNTYPAMKRSASLATAAASPTKQAGVENSDASGESTECGESAEAAKSAKSRRKVRWATSRELNGLSTWWTTFVSFRPVGVQDVFDISVPETENFIANGITVHNCCVTVATNVKDVISQVQALDQPKGASQSDTAKVDAEKVKNCAAALKNLVDTASQQGGQQQEFLDAAKKFASALGGVIELATSKNQMSTVESLKESAQALLTAAKTVFKAPQDKVAKESLELTRDKILNTIKELAPAPVVATLIVPAPPAPTVIRHRDTQSSGGAGIAGSPGTVPALTKSNSNSSLAASIVPPPAVEVHHNTPLPPPASFTSPTLTSPPPALPSPPPLAHKPLPTPPNKSELHQSMPIPPPSDTLPAPGKLSTPGPAVPAVSVKTSASLPGSPALHPGPLLPAPNLGGLTPTGSPATNRRAGLKTSGTGANEQVLAMIDYLRDNFASFKADWDSQPELRRNTHLRLIAERMAEVNSAGGGSDDLDNIANLRDFSQFKSMGTIRGRSPMPFNTITGRNIKDLLASVSSEYDPGQPASAQFRQTSESLSDVVVAFIILANQFSRGEGSSSELVDLMRKLLQLLKKILAIGSKLASSNYPEAISKLIGGALKVVDDAKVEAVVDQHVVAAATGQAVPYVDSMLRKKLYNDANALRVVTIYLLATLYAFQENITAQHILLQIPAASKTIVECAVKVNNTCATYRYILESADKRKDTSDVVNLMQENDTPIYEEKKDPSQSEYDWEIELRDKNPPTQGLGSGSFNKLVAALTSDKALDSAYMKAFIATYRSFATPWQLLEKLVQRYNVPANMPPERGLPIKLRVSVVIKYWVESHFDDFEEELVKKLFDFCDNTLLPDKQTALAKQLREFLTNKVEQRKNKFQRVLDVPPTDLSIPSGSRSPSELFMALNDEEISRQLTLIDFQLFQVIEHSELLNQAWNKDKLKYRAPNVIALLTRLNHLSYWIPCLVLWQEKQADRAKRALSHLAHSMMAKLFRVADLLRKMNNFHTLMALVAGLNNASLQRLKSTKKLVGDQLLQSWSKIEKLMHPQGAFKDYRAALHKAKPPSLPYLGMYLTDLTFIDDGNPDMVDGKINWNKRELTYRVLSEIELYQQVPYNFPPVEPIRTFLTELPGINEKELFELSLLREPREAAGGK